MARGFSTQKSRKGGQTFLKLDARMEERKQAFGLEDEELNLNLGPLGNLM